MLIKASIVIMSHLSDSQHLIVSSAIDKIHNHINFAKFVVSKFPDTQVDIDADALWTEFVATRFYRK